MHLVVAPVSEGTTKLSEKVKNAFGVRGVDVETLNRTATRTGDVRPQVTDQRPLDDIVVSEEYLTVQRLLEARCPVVFVTGNAGSGKSTLIQYLRSWNPGCVVVAPTGVAALNVGGATVHSFFRFPPRIQDPKDIKTVTDRTLFEELELLIIDEISMLRCDLMDSIDLFLRKNRASTRPFGGVQLLLVGDLFQLPPVVNKPERDVLSDMGYSSPYFFSSFGLAETSLFPVELTSCYRQEDPSFIALLNKVRIGADTTAVAEELNQRCAASPEFEPDLTLTCTNASADRLNEQEMSRLDGPAFTFLGETGGTFNLADGKLPAPFNLQLKLGARVMFTKNDDERRWVNGSVGLISRINDKSIRVTISGEPSSSYDVQPATWQTYKYVFDAKEHRIAAEKIGEYTQYPLMLAWAVTIHKSQGKTLGNVLVDLGRGAFAPGQVYVALSRCRSIEGIRLARPLRASDIRCDPTIQRFYSALQDLSAGNEGY